MKTKIYCDRIIAYLRNNPDSSTWEIAHDLNLTSSQVSRYLNNIESDGTVIVVGSASNGYCSKTKVWRLAESIEEKLNAETVEESVARPEPMPDGFYYRSNLTTLENDVLRYVYTYPGSTVTKITEGMFGAYTRSSVYRALSRLDAADLLITASLDERGTRGYYPPEASQ